MGCRLSSLDFTGERQKRHLQTLEQTIGSINAFEPFVGHAQMYEPRIGTSTSVSEEPLAFSAQSVPWRFDNSDRFSNPAGLLDTEYLNLDSQFESVPQRALPPTVRSHILASSNQHGGDQNSGVWSHDHSFSDTKPGANEVEYIPPQSAQIWDTIYRLVQEDSNLSDTLRNRILDKDIPLHEILRSGLRLLAHEDRSRGAGSIADIARVEHNDEKPALRTDKILLLQNRNRHPPESLPDIYKNNIRIKQFLFVAALAANAESLGLNIEITTQRNAVSPFFKASMSEEVAKAACTTEFSNLKTNLQPCASQMIYRHHPYIDLLPFPTFRERIIKLNYTETPMIDERELCKDLQNDGLICWGSSLGGGSSVTGSGSPWDIRSWEAQPWFLKKWWILLGGAAGEIYTQTQWWYEMRGDKSLYPW